MENENKQDGGSHWYEFDGETFTPIDDPTPNDETDFYLACATAGFNLHGVEFPSEFSDITFNLTRCTQSQKILVCISDMNEGIGQIVCTDLIAWLKFMRDYVQPICQVLQTNLMHQAFNKVESTVFDSKVGIECAVRAADRANYARQQRRKS